MTASLYRPPRYSVAHNLYRLGLRENVAYALTRVQELPIVPGMSSMFSQATRLELIIVVAALLVLLFCSQPPQSGNAQISTDAELMPQEPTPGTEDELQDAQNLPDTPLNPESHDPQPAAP